MVSYNIVKNCSLCKKRFVVSNKESKRYYCTECEAKEARERSKASK